MSNSKSSNQQKQQGSRKKTSAAMKIWPAFLAIAGLALIGLAVIVIGGQVSGNFGELTGSGAPALQVDKEKVDLGDVKLGQPVSVSFKLTNAGTKPLRFSQEPYIQVVEGC
jgi:hypothetical protein